MKNETKLGVFLFIGLIAFGLSVLTIKNVRLERGYRLHVYFNEVAGLPEKAWVRVSGVKVGNVERIWLEGGRAKVTIWVKGSVRVHRDANATIMATGLLGVKYLDLALGSDNEPLLKNGDSITGKDPVSIDTMMSKGLGGINDLADALQGFVADGDMGENLNQFIKNAKEISEKLNRNLTEEKIKSISQDVKEFSESLRKISKDLAEITGEEKTDIKAVIKNMRSVSEKLDKVLTDIEAGETTIGRLFADKEMGDDLKKTIVSLRDAGNEAKKTLSRFTLFKTNWDYNLRYAKYDAPRSGLAEEFKSDIGLQIRPKPEKFYYLGISNAGESGAVSGEKVNTVDLNIGRDFNLDGNNLFSVRAGIMRSSGGMGFSVWPAWKWSPWNRLEIYSDVYDFARTTQSGGKKPRVNVGAMVRPVKWVRLGTAVEDITEQKDFHASMNIVIEDEDIAYLLGLVGFVK